MGLLSNVKPRRPDLLTTHREWLDRIQEESEDLSVWEVDFIDSIGNELAGDRGLTEAQAEVLERIYNKHTD